VLATLLYRKAKDLKGDEQTTILKDARQVLRDSAAAATSQANGKADEITLRLIGTYDVWLGDDYDSAAKNWGELVVDAPKDKEAVTFRTWWAYSLLMEYKNAEALDAIKDQTVDPKTPELDYVIAWAKFRTGDNAGAWQAILAAWKGWNSGNKDLLERDVIVFASRGGVSLADTMSALVEGRSKAEQYEILAKLGLQGYQFAGRWADGIDSIEKAFAVAAGSVPANDVPVLRYSEADYTVRLDDPVKAAAYAKQAIDALPTCGQKCSNQDKENIVESAYIMGRLFHILYATAHDDRYYQPAHDLYQQSIPLISMNDKMREDGQKDQAYLEGSFKSMKAGQGKYDPQAIGALLGRHNQEVQACYERALAANPKLAGALVVNLDVDQNGAVKGVATQPNAGAQDMAQVAGCVATDAKSWKLPAVANGKGAAGTTRIKLTYNTAPKK
jgi:tetratricopeptide (TPR) repeat protein